MKKNLLFILLMFILTGCSISTKNILNNIEIKNVDCKIKIKKDTHGGFLGDGDYFAKIFCPDIKYDELSENWKELPLSDPLNEVMNMVQCDADACKNFYEKYDVPNITNGYYYFMDRHTSSKNKYDDTDLNNRPSWNFTLALLDRDTNTIYYYELDT